LKRERKRDKREYLPMMATKNMNEYMNISTHITQTKRIIFVIEKESKAVNDNEILYQE
jgi:hypothetical protein